MAAANRPSAPAGQPTPDAFPTFNSAGGRVTSEFRTVEHNREVGGKANSWHLKGDPEHPFAQDSVPPPGESMAEHFLKVRRANPGMTVLNEGDHVHVQPPRGFMGGQGPGKNQQRMEIAVRNAGGMPEVPTPDYSGYDAQEMFLKKAGENIAAPHAVTYKPPEYPERPAPEDLKDVDYTKSDAAFAAATPKNPFGATPEEQEKQKLKMRRASYWSGLGQAFANFRDGQGLGSLLANAGGSMLSGAMAGDERVRSKLEEFDKNMSQYNIQLGNRETTKATNTANVINQNIGQQNQYASQLWGDKMIEAKKFEPQFTPDGRVNWLKKNADGTNTITSEMFDPAAMNPILERLGASKVGRAGLTNEAQQLQYAGDMASFTMILPMAFQDAIDKGDDKTAAQSLYAAANLPTWQAVDGNAWRQVVEQSLPNGKEVAARLNYDALKSVNLMADEKTGEMIPGQHMTEQQTGAYKDYIRNNMLQTFMGTGHVHDLIGGWVDEVYTDQPGNPKTGKTFWKPQNPGVTAAIYGNAERDRTVTTRESRKGPFGSSSVSVTDR